MRLRICKEYRFISSSSSENFVLLFVTEHWSLTAWVCSIVSVMSPDSLNMGGIVPVVNHVPVLGLYIIETYDSSMKEDWVEARSVI